jgi:hypothetical protein
VFARFYKELSALPEHHPIPHPLPLTEIELLIAKFSSAGDRALTRNRVLLRVP